MEMRKNAKKTKKYLDITREVNKKQIWIMIVTVIKIIVCALETVSKCLERRLKKWESEYELRLLILQNCRKTEKNPGDLM